MKTIRTLLTGASALLFAGGANATVLLDENFDGYANQAAFEAAWTPIGTVAPISAVLATDQASSSPQSIRVDGTATTGQQRNQRSFTESGTVGVNTNITFSFDFYDSNAAVAPYRQYSSLHDGTGTGTGQLIAMGMNNNQSSANSGGNFYMARILGYSPAATDPDGGPGEAGTLGVGAFFKLNDFLLSPLRSTGWHNFKVVISSDDGLSADFAFYVDGILSETVNNVGTAATLRSYETIRLGSGVSNGSNPSWYDNFKVEVTVTPVPEPSTFMLGLMGGLGMLWLARRRAA